MNIGLLFAICVLVWGTTWFAIKFQIHAVAPEVGVALRFSLAALLLLGYCAGRGIALRLRAREHVWLVGLGVLGFSVSYLLVYHAERFIVSGLVAVGYAASPLVNMAFDRAFFGTAMAPRVALGGALGLAGVALIFWPEFTAASGSAALATGALLTATAVVASCLSNMIVARNQKAGVTGFAPIAIAMAYGALTSWAAVFVLGRPVALRWSVPFAASLLYLAVFGSIIAFAAYYTLLQRIGAARASYVGVMATVVALLVSSLLEGFDWQLATIVGVAFAAVGNGLALNAPHPPTPAAVRR